MKLKEKQEIDAAIARSHGTVTKERKQEIVAHIRGTRPEKLDELDAIFSQHLPEQEKAFYLDIVEGSKGPATPPAKPAAASPAPAAPSTKP